ncbi:MAG: hypothetical protein HY692_05060 [Cyanobacteria bacterium NC_groundwater_1444_Ag_S-0.65um_54_12]|nr:hypothetical protein [Cyanobacteria bacterium NC_groundwater_1444_Ag_S-0.65um_54_12]
MSDLLKLGSYELPYDIAIKLRPGEVEAAKKKAPKNGADNMFFRIGNDHYVASGQGFEVGVVYKNTPVAFQGKIGEFESGDNKINSPRERRPKTILATLFTIAATNAAADAVIGNKLPRVASIRHRMNAYIAIGSLVAGALVGYLFHRFQTKRPSDLEMLKAHGEVVAMSAPYIRSLAKATDQ